MSIRWTILVATLVVVILVGIMILIFHVFSFEFQNEKGEFLFKTVIGNIYFIVLILVLRFFSMQRYEIRISHKNSLGLCLKIFLKSFQARVIFQSKQQLEIV